MHARDLLELAALVSVQGASLIRCGQQLPGTSIEFYWLHSKCRLDHWARALKALSSRGSSDLMPAANADSGEPLMEEIFVSEALTRVWAAVLKAHDRQCRGGDNEPIGRNILLGHSEARHRAMSVLLDGQAIAAEKAVAINRLRLKVERWTDLLLGRLLTLFDVSEFTIEPERAREFADDLRYEERTFGTDYIWSLTFTALRGAFPPTAISTPSADLNARIAASVLGCLPSDLFNSTGSFRPFWQWRLATGTSDTQGMVDELLWTDPLSIGQSVSRREPGKQPQSWRRFG